MEPANSACFKQPHWRLIARGFDIESWLDDGQLRGTGGIAVPKEVKLRVGQRYYRFASTSSSREAQLGGGWWVGYEDFRRIDQFGRRFGYTLSESARLHLALPYSWTRVDRLVSAILMVPLRAYAGAGASAASGMRDARDAATNWTPLQHEPVTQLYIPGLYVKDRREQLYTRAFSDLVLEHIIANRRPL